MDESGVHLLQPETKQQSKHRKHLCSPPPNEAKTGMSAGKVMASHFLWCRRSTVGGLPRQGSIITRAYYADLLIQLQEKINQIWCGKLTRGVLFHQKNFWHTHPQWPWLLSRNVDSNLANTHPILLIWLPLNTTSSPKLKISVVIILPEMMMLWMLWTTFWGIKMAPSTQKGSVCSKTTGLSVLK